MKLVKLVVSGVIVASYLLLTYFRSLSEEEFEVNFSNDSQNHNIKSKRHLISSNLMTSSCADQEDLASQPYNEDYQRAIDNMQNLRGDNQALDAMKTDQNWNSYLDSLPAVYVGLLIAGIIALIIFIVEFMQIFCQSCISCFKRDTEKEPYANWSIGCSIVSAVLTTIVLFGFSIAGLSTNKTLVKSMNRGICQSLTMANHLVYGLTEKKWQGIDNIETQLRNIGQELVDTASIYADNFSTSSFLSGVDALHTQITNMQALSVYDVTLPNPTRSVPKKVQPDIIFILGSQAVLDQTKVIGSLESEYQTKTALQTNLLVKLRQSSAVLNTEAAAIKSEFDAGSTRVNSFKTKIENFKALVEKQMQDTKSAGLFVYNAGNAIYGITIAFGLLGLLSITLVLWCKLSFVKYGAYVTWMILSIMSILSFSAALIGYTQSVGLMENCEGIKLLATDSTEFDSLINFIGTKELKTCFFGDGNLSTQFSLETQFLKINEVKNDLNNIDSKASLFTQSLDQRYIYTWESQLSSYIDYSKEAVQISSASGFQQYDLPSQTLDKLNSWSNYDYKPSDGSQNAQFSLSCGAFSRDTIVYYQTLCPASSILCTNVAPISLPCCIPLDNATYDQLFIKNRMDLITSSCTNIGDYKSNYQSNFNALSTYVNELNTVLKDKVKVQLDKYQTDSNAYLTDVSTLYQKINTQFRSQSQKLIKMVTDQTTGIQNILQCNFLAEDFKNMHQGLCRSYMVRMYNSSVILIVVSCFSLVAQIAYFFSTTRMVDFIERNRVQRFVVSRQKPIIDPEKYRSHPLHDQSMNNQSYLNNNEYQPALMKDESIMYLNPDQGGEIELNKMNNAQPVKQGLLEDIQRRNNTNANSNMKSNVNPLPAPSYVAAGNGDKPALYQPKFVQQQRQPSSNNQNAQPASAAAIPSVSKFNNNFDDNDDDEDEEGLNKMLQNNNSKFGIPVGNNVIR